MAKHLARIHGTEEDKVNCPFYFKIGACRHSDRCSRLHHKPAFSPTILIKHLYRHPAKQAELLGQQQRGNNNNNNNNNKGNNNNKSNTRDRNSRIENNRNHGGGSDSEGIESFLCFFEDLYIELSKFGKIDALHICDNLGDHMIGHVYCKFRDEEEASDALQVMNGRYYDGRRMDVEFSPVTDFREARCRDYDEGSCARGGFCNFLHVKPVPICLIRSLEADAENDRIYEAEQRKNKEREERRLRKEAKRSKRSSSKDDNPDNSRDRKRDIDRRDRGGSDRGGSDRSDHKERDRKRSRRGRHEHRSGDRSSSNNDNDPDRTNSSNEDQPDRTRSGGDNSSDNDRSKSHDQSIKEENHSSSVKQELETQQLEEQGNGGINEEGKLKQEENNGIDRNDRRDIKHEDHANSEIKQEDRPASPSPQ